MRFRADQQLFLSYLVLIAVLTLTLSFGADSLLRRHLLETIEDDLRRELVLGRALYDNVPHLSPDSVADLAGRLSGRRVTIVTPEGRVVGESGEPADIAQAPEDYRTRPEIRTALERGEGRAIRWSTTMSTEHLYLAVLSERGEVIRIGVPLSEISRALAGVQRGILGVGAFSVLLAGLFSFGFSVFITRPLRQLGDVARALAAGDLSRRTRIRRGDELGDLGHTLNALADELQRRLGQLEGERAEMQALIDSMSEGVLAVAPNGALRRTNPAARRIFALGARPEGITPEMVSRRPEFLRLIEGALEGEAVPPRELTGDGVSLLATAHPLPDGGAVLVFLDISELRRLEGVRRDFVANASHELKTPLTVIRGYSETLLDPGLPPELARRFAEIVKENADRLQHIVDDLLDLSRIEAGGWRVEPVQVDVRSIATEAWRAQTDPEKGEAVALRFEIAQGREGVHVDPGALRQVFTNLFSNALRYTPVDGSVTVGVRRAELAEMRRVTRPDAGTSWSVVEVRDTGSGMASAHLQRIFERFYRADPARSREEGGTGLGLAIVRHLVEAHGGWIEADSLVGVGTTIRFALPAVDAGASSGS